jgi:hypothetical protein
MFNKTVLGDFIKEFLFGDKVIFTAILLSGARGSRGFCGGTV